MFKGLKNKIREETGNDISKIVPILSGGPQKTNLVKGRHSRQGSTSSIGSISLDGVREENSQSPVSTDKDVPSEIINTDGKILSPKELKQLEKKEEEWKKKFQKLDCEWKKKLEDKEREWKKQLESKDKEKDSLEKTKLQLTEALAHAEEFKRKYCQFQEEKEQLEGFQTQEMAKIKHLLLAKEQEVAAKVNALKESNAQLASLRSEVNRLRRFEQELSNIQDEMETLRHSSEQERATLRSELAQSEENVRHLRDRVVVLERRASADCVALGGPLSPDERVQGLLGERALLERRLEEAHLHLADIKSSWSSKIASLETQVGRLCRQAGEEGAERRRAEEECSRLEERVRHLETELANATDLLSDRNSVEQQNEHLRLELDTAIREKLEVSDKLTSSQEISNEEIKQLTEALESECSLLSELRISSEFEVNKLKEDIAQLRESENARSDSLLNQLADANKEIEIERIRCAEMMVALDRERRERDSTLIRNAEVSQQVELSNQLLRAQEVEMADLQSRFDVLEVAMASKEKELQQIQQLYDTTSARVKELEHEHQQELTACSQEKQLKEMVAELEAQLLEKNKNIKQLQQRLGDMKKTLQRELKFPGGGQVAEHSLEETNAAVLAPSASHQVSQRRLQQQAGTSQPPSDYDNVNSQYLKHVLIKFLTSREYEAQHLTRAVATLLHFSPAEEKLLRETLEWKMSWFGSRPVLGNGQTAKTIPPR